MNSKVFVFVYYELKAFPGPGMLGLTHPIEQHCYYTINFVYMVLKLLLAFSSTCLSVKQRSFGLLLISPSPSWKSEQANHRHDLAFFTAQMTTKPAMFTETKLAFISVIICRKVTNTSSNLMIYSARLDRLSLLCFCLYGISFQPGNIPFSWLNFNRCKKPYQLLGDPAVSEVQVRGVEQPSSEAHSKQALDFLRPMDHALF